MITSSRLSTPERQPPSHAGAFACVRNPVDSGVEMSFRSLGQVILLPDMNRCSVRRGQVAHFRAWNQSNRIRSPNLAIPGLSFTLKGSRGRR